MLNPFPEFLNYSPLAPMILRLLIGLIFVDLGFLKFRGEKDRWMASFEALHLRSADFFVPLYFLRLYGFLQIVAGTLLIIGLWTQVAALFFVLSTGAELYVEWRAKEILKRDLVFYLLIFTISLSLLLTGAGAFAFDLPL